MKYLELVNKLREHSANIAQSSNQTARFRAASYERAASLIETNMKMHSTVSQLALSKLPFTEYMLGKIMDAVHGKLKVADIDKPESSLAKQLADFPGIGAARAKQLINAGLKRISQLEQKKYKELLTNETLLMLKYKPQRIPRKAIEDFEKTLEPLKKKYKWYIVGSYRRNKPTSGDIDLMLVSDTSITKDFVADLAKLNYSYHIYAAGNDRYGTLLNLKPAGHNIWVRADFFRASLEDAPAMLLYSTGSKEHNVLMRAKAKKLGLLLNQRGLFHGNKKLPISDEKGFFDALGLAYKPPEAR